MSAEDDELEELIAVQRALRQGREGLLGSDATREARDALVSWLQWRAEYEANGSRDFGRGFAHAINVLGRAPAECRCCELPAQAPIGQWFSCLECGKRWFKQGGTTWNTSGRVAD